jgi:outer membrane murein-binding lipoprotein Lpp
MKRISAIILIGIACISLSGCSSNSKYEELEARVSHLEELIEVNSTESGSDTIDTSINSRDVIG